MAAREPDAQNVSKRPTFRDTCACAVKFNTMSVGSPTTCLIIAHSFLLPVLSTPVWGLKCQALVSRSSIPPDAMVLLRISGESDNPVKHVNDGAPSTGHKPRVVTAMTMLKQMLEHGALRVLFP